MRRFSITGMAVMLLMWLIPVQALAAPPESKTVVCHVKDNGTYNAIEVAEKAVPAHLNHGDGLIGGDVPHMDGYVFGEDCAAELDLSKTSTTDFQITVPPNPEPSATWAVTFSAKETKDGGDEGFFQWTENDGTEVFSWAFVPGTLAFQRSGSEAIARFDVTYEVLEGTEFDDWQKVLFDTKQCSGDLISGESQLEVLIFDGGTEFQDSLAINVPCPPGSPWTWAYDNTNDGNLIVEIND